MIQQTLSVESFIPGQPADYLINIVVSSQTAVPLLVNILLNIVVIIFTHM